MWLHQTIDARGKNIKLHATWVGQHQPPTENDTGAVMPLRLFRVFPPRPCPTYSAKRTADFHLRAPSSCLSCCFRIRTTATRKQVACLGWRPRQGALWLHERNMQRLSMPLWNIAFAWIAYRRGSGGQRSIRGRPDLLLQLLLGHLDVGVLGCLDAVALFRDVYSSHGWC